MVNPILKAAIKINVHKLSYEARIFNHTNTSYRSNGSMTLFDISIWYCFLVLHRFEVLLSEVQIHQLNKSILAETVWASCLRMFIAFMRFIANVWLTPISCVNLGRANAVLHKNLFKIYVKWTETCWIYRSVANFYFFGIIPKKSLSVITLRYYNDILTR